MSGTGKPIHYVVPDGFRGTIYIVEDPSYDDPPFEEGRWVFRFTDSGVLFVKSLHMFEQWHSSTAEWQSGAELYCYPDPGRLEVAIRGGRRTVGDSTRDHPSYISDFVGPDVEFLASWYGASSEAKRDFRHNGVQAE